MAKSKMMTGGGKTKDNPFVPKAQPMKESTSTGMSAPTPPLPKLLSAPLAGMGKPAKKSGRKK